MRWIAACVLTACAGSAPARVEPPRPPPIDVAPTLALTTPARGAFVDGSAVVVGGVARDDGAVRVTVNGVEVAVAPDGTFSASVVVTSGIAVLETHAIDRTGHDVRDVRAVLVGPFAPADGSVRTPFGASLGRDGLAALGPGLATSLKASDLAGMARAMGPLFDRDGCLGARGDVARVTLGKLAIALYPKPGAIAAFVTVDAVEVGIDVRYTLACFDGDTTVTVRTDVRAHGDLQAKLVGGRIHTSFAATVDLVNFQVDLPGVPGPIERLLRGLIRVSIEQELTRALAIQVPPLADKRLAEVLAKPPASTVLGRDLQVEVVPRRVDFTASGAIVAADVALTVAGGQAGRYATVPARISGPEPAAVGIWVAADAVNQLLAGLWAAHAFDRTVAVADVGPLAMVLGAEVRTLELAFALPPTVSVGANGALELAVGELGITLRDADQVELQRFAVSLRSAIAIEPGGAALTASRPTVVAQLISQGATVEHPLDREVVEGVVQLAWSLVAGSMNGALAGVALPGAGVAVDVRGLTGRDGMFVLELSPHAP